MRTPVGKVLARGLGLPVPPRLDRWVPGSRVVDGAVVLGSAPAGRLAAAVERQLEALAVMTVAPTGLGADEQAAALVFDASGIDAVESLSALRDFFNPLLRRLGRCGRVLVLGTPPDAGAEPAAAVAQRGLEGFTRSLAKEVRAGATVQLVLVSPGAEDRLESTLAFLLSPRSAFVSGQVVRVGTGGMTGLAAPYDVEQPLGGRVALVTGAAQGIGAAIARVLHR
ncbi:MAG: short chain dehydrogenase, partial [Actinomycetota bacterium]|nr:short chain dehydrogenase [Actinomycetota bacterium]